MQKEFFKAVTRDGGFCFLAEQEGSHDAAVNDEALPCNV